MTQRSFAFSLSGPTARLMVWFILGIFLVATSGCGGCTKKATVANKKTEKEKKPKKKKKPYLSMRPSVVPTDDVEDGTQLNAIKPGHWTTITQRMIANNEDTQVEIRSSVIDQFDRRVRLDNTAYELVATRAAAMPKERIREFESLFYIPRSKKPILRNRVVNRRNGAIVIDSTRPAMVMPAYQTYFVVLSTEPDRLKFLKSSHCVRSLSTFEDGPADVIYNRVAYLQPDAKTLPLPSHSLTWTSISVVFWDRLDPNRVSASQQTALLDWLHWGGRLIISGPGSMERLRGSFLEPYLPADRTDAVELTADHLSEFNDTWSVPPNVGAPGPEQSTDTTPVSVKAGMVGVQLKTINDGYFVAGTGELVAEARVGRGSIVATSFSLADRAVTTWPSYDSFINGCLLQRPRRQFSNVGHTATEVRLDTVFGSQDPRLVSNLRYFSRDTPPYGDGFSAARASWAVDPSSGVAAWNDDSGTSAAARTVLKDAAGISIPQVGFVLRTLAVYLLIIVPVNWLFFRLIGRVEWAWVAAPLIAIGGSLAVVRLAELDIGFARSRTEVATLEFHGGYDRAHVSRYNALYTSLTSQYSLAIAESNALAQPFPTESTYSPGSYDTIHEVRLRRGRNMEMDGFHVGSNSTGMVHSEQMFDLGGRFHLTGDDESSWMVRNQSDLSISGVGLLRRDGDQLQVAWIGDLPSRQAKPAKFELMTSKQWAIDEWSSVAPFARSQSDDGQLKLRALWSVAVKQLAIEENEVRLIGWRDEALEGIEFKPAASQTRSQTLVVGHFWVGKMKRPARDENLPPPASDDEFRVLRDSDLLNPELEQPGAPTRPPTPGSTPTSPIQESPISPGPANDVSSPAPE